MKITSSGLDNFLAEMSTVARHIEADAVSAVQAAQAVLVAAATQPDSPIPIDTGGLRESFKARKVTKNKSGVVGEVAYDGYDGKATKKSPKGRPYPLIGYVFESGSPRMPKALHPVQNLVDKNEDAIVNAMEESIFKNFK